LRELLSATSVPESEPAREIEEDDDVEFKQLIQQHSILSRITKPSAPTAPQTTTIFERLQPSYRAQQDLKDAPKEITTRKARVASFKPIGLGAPSQKKRAEAVVSKIPAGATQEEIKRFFLQFGRVESVSKPLDGTASVVFHSEEWLKRAIADCDKFQLNGSQVAIRPKGEPSEGGRSIVIKKGQEGRRVVHV